MIEKRTDAEKANLHFHLRSKYTMVRSRQIWRTIVEVDRAYYEQLAKYHDQDGILEIIPCVDIHEKES